MSHEERVIGLVAQGPPGAVYIIHRAHPRDKRFKGYYICAPLTTVFHDWSNGHLVVHDSSPCYHHAADASIQMRRPEPIPLASGTSVKAKGRDEIWHDATIVEHRRPIEAEYQFEYNLNWRDGCEDCWEPQEHLQVASNVCRTQWVLGEYSPQGFDAFYAVKSASIVTNLPCSWTYEADVVRDAEGTLLALHNE